MRSPGTLARAAMRATERYRGSRIHDRVGHSCRFAPTCSHYADDALRSRSLPVALLLIAWRLLRCTPLTPQGTVDRVAAPDRSLRGRLAGALALAGLTTLLVSGTAAAAGYLAAQAGSSTTAGGCDAFVAGVPIGTLDAKHSLQVHKGQGIVLTGKGPAGVRNLSSVELSATTTVRIHFVEKLATTTFTERSTGQQFQRAVNVDTYLKYGSGIYRVDVHSVATPGWDCSATFYVELHGSKLAAEVAVAVGGVGAVGVVASKGDEPPESELPPRRDDHGMYDPGIAPDKLEQLQAQKDKARNAKATSTVGCLAAILFALIASTGAFAAAVPPPGGGSSSDGRRRVWVRGHPVLGFVSGLFAGLGTTVALQQFGLYPLNLTSAVVAPLVTAVLGGWRGWRGCAWVVG